MWRSALHRLSRAWLWAALLVACDRPPSADGLREWTPADHDRGESGKRGPASPQTTTDAAANAAEARMVLVESAWRTQCASCHGPEGRGDGPQGPLLRATNLTAEAWQSRVTDAQIAQSIRAGKGQMPKFDLPDDVIEGLVARIRSVRE